MSQESQEYKDLEALINAKVIKFAVGSKEEFESDLFDEIVCDLDENFREYLCKHSSDFIAETSVPQNFDDLIENASSNEYRDDVLKKILDNSLYNSIKKSILEDMSPSLKEAYYHPRKEIREIAFKAVEETTKLEFSQYQKRNEHIRYSFEWRNRSLLLKNSVSSSILTNEHLYSYYDYKLNNFKTQDANLYIKGLNAAIPLISNNKIDDFSMVDILEIRKMKKWRETMSTLGEMCSAAKFHYNNEEFKDEINYGIMTEIYDAYDKTKPSLRSSVKDAVKNAVWAGISLIPIAGPIVSGIGSVCDPIASYLINEKKQQALPVFMTEIRKKYPSNA